MSINRKLAWQTPGRVMNTGAFVTKHVKAREDSHANEPAHTFEGDMCENQLFRLQKVKLFFFTNTQECFKGHS